MRNFLLAVLLAVSVPVFSQTNTISIVGVPSGVDVPTGQRPRLESSGVDSTVYMDYWCKGDCAHVFRSWSGGSHAFYGYAESQSANSFIGLHGATNVAKVRAVGTGSNVPLRLEPQGAAAIEAKNAIQLVMISTGGVMTTIGFIGSCGVIEGTSSTDMCIRFEPGKKLLIKSGGSEVARFE
jgi:hypothetical protein